MKSTNLRVAFTTEKALNNQAVIGYHSDGAVDTHMK